MIRLKRFYRPAGAVLALMLAACRTSPSTALPSPPAVLPASPIALKTATLQPSPTALTPTETAVAAYPAPGLSAPTPPLGIYPPPAAYPGPGLSAPTLQVEFTQPPAAYPAPATDLPTDNPYPGPGDAQAGPPVPPVNTPASGIDSPYPAPQVPAVAPTTSAMINTPAVAQTNVQSSPPALPSQEISTPGSPTVTAIPTTPPVVRTNLTATDPASVKLASGKLQLLEFFAYWCPLCKSMAPVLHLLEDKYAGKVIFSYLDVDNSATRVFKTTLGYHFPPQIFLLDGQGKVLQQWAGYVGPDELEKALTDQGARP